MAISGRHCRSERAIVKTVRTSDLSLRGAKRRGNLGKALPFGTSHRKNGTHLRFVIARSEATWQSREGTPDLYRPPLKQCWPPRLVIARRPEADVAISGRHPRSVPAAVKTVLAPRFVIARRPEADVAISGRHCRSERAIVKTVRTSDLSLRGAKRRGNLAVLARITEKLRRIRPPERQSKHETVLCLPFDQQRKYCPVHRHDKRPAKKIVRASGRPRGWLYKAILCQKISLF